MSDAVETPKRRPVRSYVLRGGRITAGQRRAFETAWPLYGLTLAEGKINYESVFRRETKTVLEIGFGMGDSLLQMAQAEPATNFIGVEVHPPGVGRLLAAIERTRISNLRIYQADALDVLQTCISPYSLACIQVFFPDPWHKQRHHKRRLIQPPFVDLVVQRLRPKGIFHVATDWRPYAGHCMQTLLAHPQLYNDAGGDNFAARPERRPLTKFEQRGQRLGHAVWDLIFTRQ